MRFVPLIIASIFSIIWAFISACIVVGLTLSSGVKTPAYWDTNAKLTNFWDWIVFVYEVFTFSSASIVVSLFVFSGALGIHLSGIEYLRDLNDDEDRNMGF